MATWKPRGSASIPRASSPFNPGEMMGGGGGGGSPKWPTRSQPKWPSRDTPGITYQGKPVGFNTGSKVISSSFSTKQANLRAKDRKITAEQHQREENAAKMNRRMYEGSKPFDMEASVKRAGFKSIDDWRKALQGETAAEKEKFYRKKRGDH